MKSAATVALLGVLAIIGVAFISKMLLVQSYLGNLGLASCTRGVHRVSPHVLKALPHDVILEMASRCYNICSVLCACVYFNVKSYDHNFICILH